MHTKIKYLLLFFVLIAAAASAQKSLVVYHVAGNVNIITANKSSAAKRGDILVKNNSLQVKQGTCMLIEENGKSLQVNSAGTYTFETLQKMMSSAANTGVTQKFFSYVYSNLFSGKKEDKLSVTPVVFRGDELMKLPADNTIIIADAFMLGWKKPAGKIPVHLVILNNADEKILDTILNSATSLQVDVTKNNFLPGNIYKWKAEESGTRQPKEKYFYFLIAGKSDRKQILKDLKLLQTNISGELKIQMQQDIFQKWKQHYLQED